MLEKFSLGTLRIRLISILLLAGIIPILLIGLIGYMTSKSTILRQSGVINLQSLQQVNDTLEDRLSTIQSLAGAFHREEEIVSILENNAPVSDVIQYAREWDAFNNVWNKNVLYSFNSPPLLTIYGTNGKVFSSWKSDGSNLKTYLDQQKIFNEITEQTNNSDDPYWTNPHENFTFENKKLLISYVSTFKDASNEKSIGKLLLTIPIDDLYKSYLNNNEYIIFSGNDLLFSTMSSAPTNKEKDELFSLIENQEAGFQHEKWNGNKVMLIHDQLYNGWSIIQLIPYSDLVGDLNKIRNILLLITIILAAFSIGIGQGLSRKIMLPMNQLVHMMRKVGDGNWNVSFTGKVDSELDRVVIAFNQMTIELKEMHNRIEWEQRLKSELEFNALLAQVHPHLIKNTLATIQGLALKGQTNEISLIINSLGFLLSSKIYLNSKTCSLSEELEHLEHYLIVMRIRYPDRFQVYIEVPETMMLQQIVRFTIQPIVENSIYHGMNTGQKLHIWIQAYYQGSDCLITIIDDGRGTELNPLEAHAEREKLQRYYSEQKVGFAGFSGIGLTNIQQRIQLHYGKQYGLQFKSNLNSGTQVHMKLPKENESGGML